MYQAEAIKTCFAGLVGFNQPDDPSYPLITDSLLTSTSGKKLQGVHPLCTIENLVNCGPEFHNYVYPAWISATAYKKGQYVTYSGTIYRAKANTNGTTNPSADATNWGVSDPFSDWLQGIYDDACLNLVSDYVMTRKINEKGRSLHELKQLYSGVGSINSPILAESRFVGLEIQPVKAMGIALRFDKIGFQATQGQSELIFYLYHSSKSEPIFEMPVVVGNNYDFSWTDLTNKVISYMDGTDSDGVYYFGYYENDLQGQAIKKEMAFNQGPCQSCNDYDFYAYNAWSKYTTIKAIEVPFTATKNDNSLFDTSKVEYVRNSNFGINLSIAILCDFTTTFCMNKSVFADALQQRLGLEVLNKLAFCTRINAISEADKKLAMAELDPKENSGSFMAQYMKYLRALDIDMSGLNGACLPCDSYGRIKVKSV